MSHEPFELFMAVFETGSFSAAAKKCHKSPSAISKQIAALETQYGATFFDRTTRRVHATEAGRVYYAYCRTMHLAHRDVSKELESLSGKPAGDIRITWPAGLAFSHLTENMGQFAALYPDIRFDVMATNDVVNMKEEGI